MSTNANAKKGATSMPAPIELKDDKNLTAAVAAIVAEEKPAKTAKPKPAYLLFLTALIEEGKLTQKELKLAGVAKFPDVAKSTIETVLVDSKNVKYNRFPKLVVKDEKGILTFKKAV